MLALQGAFREHLHHLGACGAEGVEVRLPEQLVDLDALILPGGESTTLSQLIRRFGLEEPLRRWNRPLWGTCAGMILLGREVVDGVEGQLCLGHIDLRVRRNAMGRQLESCRVELEVDGVGLMPAVFIRAPLAEPLSSEVEVLARHQGQVAAARQGTVWVTAFHPELSDDLQFHRAFLASFSPLPSLT